MHIGGGVPNIVLGCVKCVWMCELECWGLMLRSPVYSACVVSFDTTWSWFMCQHVVAWVIGICAG